jgi:predicted Zn-dependent peptidase
MKNEKTVLNNGATIIGINMPSAKSVVINFGFRVGSRDEEPTYAGISHFLEHMVFKGSKRRPTAAAIAKEADRIGAKYNAFTGKEYTCYYIQTTLDNFDLGLDIIGDMVTQPLLKQTELNKEVGTIIEEIKMYEDNPMINIYGRMEETLFGAAAPMGREIAGSARSVKSVNAAVMKKYCDSFYVGSNAVLVMAGNLPKDYVKKGSQYLSRLPKGSRNERVSDSKYRHGLKLIPKKTEQAHFGLCLPSFAISDSEKFAAEIIATALGGYMSARLFTEIREKRGWAYRIQAYSDPSQDTGYLGVIGGIKRDKITEAIEVTKKEIIKFRDNFKTEEIKRAKSHLVGSSTLTFDDPEERAKFTVLQELINDRPETPEETIKMIQKISEKEIKTVAQKMLDLNKISLTIIGPYKNKEKFAKILAQGKKE